MKFLLPSFALFATALGQGLTIGTPAEGDQIIQEEPFTIQVIKNPHIMGSTEVGLAIGIIGCPEETGCPAIEQMGTVLYSGPFEPEIHPGTPGAYQNFTVTVPSSQELLGSSRIGVARAFLIGAQNGVVLQTYGAEVETAAA